MVRNKKFSRVMTVAHVRRHEGRDYAEVMFLESAQIYRLPKDNPSFRSMIVALEDAIATKRQVEVQLQTTTSNVIEDIRPIRS